MKKVSRIAIIILLMLGTLSTFIFMAMDSRKQPAARTFAHTGQSTRTTTATVPANAKGKSLVMSDEEFSLGVGESYQCAALLDDGNFAEGLQWSSADPEIVGVDGSGKVTAVAEGSTQITAALIDSVVATASVSVYGDPKSAAVTAISRLAADGSDESMRQFKALQKQFSLSKGKTAKPSAALLNALGQFADIGAGKSGSAPEAWKKLNETVTDAGVDSLNEAQLRRAALSAYCQGEKSVSAVTLSFAGDCTFAYFNESDRANMFPAVYRNSGSVTYPFDRVKNVFGADDVTLVNLEGALTTSQQHREKTFYFRGEPSYVNILTGSSVEAVTVENNHSGDYFEQGFNDTLQTLKNAGIRFTSRSEPAVIDVNGYKVVMLSLSLVGKTYTPEIQSQLEAAIGQYRGSKTVVVVNLHWGIESSGTPEHWQVDAAHSIIDAGADLIIGHHPHVLQGIEVYNGHYIVYSLGNFSFGGNMAAINPQTMIFRIAFSETDTGSMRMNRVSVVPCYTTSSGSTANNFQPMPLFGETGKAVVDKVIALSTGLENGAGSLSWSRIP